MTTKRLTGIPGGGLIIAAPASGSGKTLVTLGLLRRLRDEGVDVASAKVGPDYIDPAFHAAATGRPCPNLDPWAMRETTLAQLAADLAASADDIVVEGVMGLFDGAEPTDDKHDGSTAALAEITGWPVILVIDAARQAASAAVVAKAFAQHRPSVDIAGVIFNRIGGPRHAEILTDALRRFAPDLEVFGCLPRIESLALPERHLGLVQAQEHAELDGFLAKAAEWIGAHLDIPAIRRVMRPWPVRPKMDGPVPIPPLGQRIAIARDDAFSFVYPAVVEGWRKAGAEISFFSPLTNQSPNVKADAVYLPGGYPELHAGRLSANWDFMEGLQRAADESKAIYGECGGYMVLGQGLTDASGRRHPMAGLLPLETSFAKRRLHLGYRRVTLAKNGPLGPARRKFRGHEFHYATVIEEGPGIPLFRIEDAVGTDLGETGLGDRRVQGSFVHLIDQAE
ncbi:MAG: cobyrinate a,c-diamide synthase [Proteobacteria bacterium]|nr:cobyrinate a,c-diamide synthase [Pseudomonadota bacterium]